MEEQTNTMRSLQKELDELKESRQRDRDRESRRMRDDSDELQILRQRVEELERDKEDLQMQVCPPSSQLFSAHSCPFRPTSQL